MMQSLSLGDVLKKGFQILQIIFVHIILNAKKMPSVEKERLLSGIVQITYTYYCTHIMTFELNID